MQASDISKLSEGDLNIVLLFAEQILCMFVIARVNARIALLDMIRYATIQKKKLFKPF